MGYPATRIRRIVALLALVTCVFVACASGPAGAARAAEVRYPRLTSPYPPLAIEHVDIWPMTAANVLEKDMTVLIRNGRIERILRAGRLAPPHGFKVVNGRGKWLMPALTDMHVHQEDARLMRLLTHNNSISPARYDNADLLLPFVANGVLQILNPGAMTEQIGLRDEVEAGQVLGPHMELSALVDGSPPIWPVGLSHVATTPEDGRQFVRDAKADGYDFVKTYSRLDLATFTAIVDEARKQHIRVIGHIPGRGLGETAKWFQPGYEMVMHAEEYAYQTNDPNHWVEHIPEYVSLAKRTGVLLCATLTVDERIVQQMRDPSTLETRPEMRYVNPVTRFWWTHDSPYAHPTPQQIAFVAKVVAFNRKLVKAFADAGLPVFPGTDTTVPGLVSGFALHDELEALAAAGLTPQQILSADTRRSAEFLHVIVDRGTVEVGKRADLLLLGADPMANVRNTRDIVAVMASGRYLPRRELDRMMAGLAHRYETMPPISTIEASAGRPGSGAAGD